MSHMSANQYKWNDTTVEDINILTADGARLAGSHFIPEGNAELCLIVNGATGVPCSFYFDFAAWFCKEKKAHVIVYDYRDFGRSANGLLKDSKATMVDWCVKDQGAVLNFVVESFKGLPIWGVGHSLGGLGLLFHEHADKVEKLIAVASGPAHIFRHPAFFIPVAIGFWYMIGPLTTLWSGYLPGRKIGFGADLPSGVYWQWRRWCLRPNFYQREWGTLLPEPDLTKYTGELKLVAASDDTFVSVGVSADLAKFYPNASPKSQTVLRPQDYNLRSIGHLHALSERCKMAWPQIIS